MDPALFRTLPERAPHELGAPEIEAYLTELATVRHVSASTQKQAFSALLFLYRQVLGIDLGTIDALRARRPRTLPTVLSPENLRCKSKKELVDMSNDIQQRMDAAFENYFALSAILQEDVKALLDAGNDSQQWRRNFIRVSAALLEGYAHCIRQMCAVGLECVAPKLSKKEKEVLLSEANFSANERIKLTLRAAYKLFQLQPAPRFGGKEWPRAQRVLEKRHSLMHPKEPSDLEVTDEMNVRPRPAPSSQISRNPSSCTPKGETRWSLQKKRF